MLLVLMTFIRDLFLHIIDLSITIETVPSFLKKIKVIPLFCLTHDLAVWAGLSIRLSIKFLNSKQFLVADT